MSTPRTRMGELFGSIKWTVAIGLIFATLYSIYVLVFFFIVGGEPFQKHNTSVWAIIATYFAGGITGGVAIGALRPYARSRFAAIAVGFVASIFVIFGILLAARGEPTAWTELDWETLIVVSLLFGIVGGSMFWNNPI